MKNKNKILPSVLIALGILSISYDLYLLISSPGTFLDIITSFSHIWLALGAFLIFVAIYRIKKNHSFWQVLKKWQKRCVIIFLIVGLIISVVNLSFIFTPKIADINSPGDFVILLGGGIDKNGNLPDSVMLRVKKTAEYLNQNKDSICVVSGGRLKWFPYAEAPELKNQLVKFGINENRILVEDEALDTIQNFQLSVNLISKEKNISVNEILEKNWIIVTSDFHLRRAERLANRMGFKNVRGIACKTPAIKKLHSYVREICSYIKLNARIILTGKPEPLNLP